MFSTLEQLVNIMRNFKSAKLIFTRLRLLGQQAARLRANTFRAIFIPTGDGKPIKKIAPITDEVRAVIKMEDADTRA